MKPKTDIIYFGDTSLSGAAAYLGGVMTHAGLEFRYVSSDTSASAALDRETSLYIISDYPVKNFTAAEMDRLASAVKNGAGLLMIGGWESFHGQIDRKSVV